MTMDDIGKNLKVSIVTVCYNSAKTIEKTIQNVVNQTYNNIEYIIIDGGSTDGTLDIIKKYKEKIFYWVSESDDGIYDAMNKGIKLATGSIVGIINSDDWYDLSAVQNVVNCFQKSNTELVHGNIMLTTEKGKMLFEKRYVIADSYVNGMLYNHPTVFIKKEIYEKYGVFNTQYKIAADYELLLRLEEAQVKFVYLPQILTYFRSGGVSGSQRKWKCFIETRNILQMKQNDFSQNGDFDKVKLISAFLEKYRMGFMRVFFRERMNKTKSMNYGSDLLVNRNKKKYIVFGTGAIGYECIKFFKNNMDLIDCFVDNSIERQAEYMCGIPIRNPAQMYMKDKMVLIASTDYYEEIARQLEKMGLIYEEDYMSYMMFQKKQIENYITLYVPWLRSLPQHVFPTKN